MNKAVDAFMADLIAKNPSEPQFHQAVEKLNAAIHTDWDWVKAQTRLETRAQEWNRHRKEGSWLLVSDRDKY